MLLGPAACEQGFPRRSRLRPPRDGSNSAVDPHVPAVEAQAEMVQASESIRAVLARRSFCGSSQRANGVEGSQSAEDPGSKKMPKLTDVREDLRRPQSQEAELRRPRTD